MRACQVELISAPARRRVLKERGRSHFASITKVRDPRQSSSLLFGVHFIHTNTVVMVLITWCAGSSGLMRPTWIKYSGFRLADNQEHTGDRSGCTRRFPICFPRGEIIHRHGSSWGGGEPGGSSWGGFRPS